jgi:hypothetical protein
MHKRLRIFFTGLFLLAALGSAQTAAACPDAHPDQASYPADASSIEHAALLPEAFGMGPADPSSGCDCGCDLSGGSGTGCAGHGVVAFAASAAGVDAGVTVAQFFWFSPTFSFLVPADTEPPRAAA